jgi:hypothetical protein
VRPSFVLVKRDLAILAEGIGVVVPRLASGDPILATVLLISGFHLGQHVFHELGYSFAFRHWFLFSAREARCAAGEHDTGQPD